MAQEGLVKGNLMATNSTLLSSQQYLKENFTPNSTLQSNQLKSHAGLPSHKASGVQPRGGGNVMTRTLYRQNQRSYLQCSDFSRYFLTLTCGFNTTYFLPLRLSQWPLTEEHWLLSSMSAQPLLLIFT
jgi:hypothetical protein